MNDSGSCDPGPTFVVRINTWKMLMQSKVLQELTGQLIVAEVKKRNIIVSRALTALLLGKRKRQLMQANLQ